MSVRSIKLLAASATLAVALQPVLSLAGVSQHCYNNNPAYTCQQNPNCQQASFPAISYCKQLTAPYTDTGCCSYTLQKVSFATKPGDPTPCPCVGNIYQIISGANLNANLLCVSSLGTVATCNIDTQGTCQSLPGVSCQSSSK